MTARTPGPWHRIGRPIDTFLAIAAANDGPLNGSALELVKDAQREYLDLKTAHDALTAERDALREVLRALVDDREQFVSPDEDAAAETGTVAALYANARRALAGGGK